MPFTFSSRSPLVEQKKATSAISREWGEEVHIEGNGGRCPDAKMSEPFRNLLHRMAEKLLCPTALFFLWSFSFLLMRNGNHGVIGIHFAFLWKYSMTKTVPPFRYQILIGGANCGSRCELVFT
jgi:hypothetical protein